MIRRRLAWMAVLAGCSRLTTRSSVSIDTLATGTIQVVNHAPSGWADTNGWKIVLEAEHTYAHDVIGAIDHPNYPHTFANGEMFVVDQTAPSIERYAADFTPQGAFGRKGSGPGEFQSPEARVFGDSIAVLDNSRSVLLLFTHEGKYLQEAVIPAFTDWMGDRDRRGLLPLLGRYRAKSGAGVMWWSFSERRVVDSIIGPAGPEERMWQSCHFVIPYQPSLDLTPTLSGAAWYGVSDKDQFVLTRTGSDTLRLVETPGRPRFPVDVKRIDEFFKPDGFIFKHCGAEMHREDVPTQRPAWSSLVVDGQDNLWVSRPAKYGRSYDVYDPTGRWLGEVPSPIGAAENEYWSGDMVLSVKMLDDGGYTLKRYRIRRSAR